MDAKIAELVQEWDSLSQEEKTTTAIILEMEERVAEMINEQRQRHLTPIGAGCDCPRGE